MRSILRGLAVLVVAAAASLTVAGTATAADTSDPCQAAAGYAPPAGCQVLVQDVTATCNAADDAATLDYTLTLGGGLKADKVTVVLTSASGAARTFVDQPLSGSIPWPSTITSANSTVTFSTQTDTVYTASKVITTPTCVSQVLAADGSPSSSGVLAATGANIGPVIAIAVALLIIGAAGVLVARRRHAQR